MGTIATIHRTLNRLLGPGSGVGDAIHFNMAFITGVAAFATTGLTTFDKWVAEQRQQIVYYNQRDQQEDARLTILRQRTPETVAARSLETFTLSTGRYNPDAAKPLATEIAPVLKATPQLAKRVIRVQTVTILTLEAQTAQASSEITPATTKPDAISEIHMPIRKETASQPAKPRADQQQDWSLNPLGVPIR